jgi:preprotein translocase subunit SecA
MFKSLTKLIGGDPIARQLEQYAEYVQAINALEEEVQSLSDEVLKGKTAEFRRRISQGETLDDLLFEAFAVVREVAVRTIGLRHFDVQLIGGIVLHKGMIAEMRTGEGKTLVATMPIYLNALSGRGVHLVTVNDYLARRDARWMGPIFHYLGLSVGVLQEAARTEGGRKAFLYDPSRESMQEDIHQLRLVDRKEAYAADVTYGTNNEFGFDYLRDNMARRLEDRSQREHHFAILDEVDNILIDEARTPLIISGPSHEDPELYVQMAQAVTQLSPEDFEVSERDRTVALTEIGEDHIERILGVPLRDPDRPEDISPEQARMLGHLEQALRAKLLFKRNKDYVVQGGRVIIVDEFTGRMMAGRRWSDGLHQAVEAKEGVRVRQENVTYATITLQNYFRMYEKLSGMTGTALTEAEEFNKIYNVDVIPLPTNLDYIAMQPDSDLVEVEYRENGNKFEYYSRTDDQEELPIFWKRKDYPDVVYRTEEAKLRMVTAEILQRHVKGQPLLVGTTSVELSEKLSGRLNAELLRRLVAVLLVRDAYFEVNDIPDDGMRVEELEPLSEPLEKLNQATLRQFARDLKISLSPSRPENLERLGRIFDLEPDLSSRIPEILDSGIPHNVLNAKKHDEESRIIADAGALGAVTIATNMAGRGVDIKLGGELAEEVLASVNRVLRRADVEEPESLNMEERLQTLKNVDPQAVGIYDAEINLFRSFMENGKRVKEVGGLHVLGSERHEARRIDNQLRGRAARQGDPGSSQFFLSLEDELMRLFGGTQVSGLMQRFNIDDTIPIAHNIVNRTIEQAQTRVEGANFDTRKHLLEYDDVLNQQREVFYNQRNRVFTKDQLNEDVSNMVEVEVDRHTQTALEEPDGMWKLLAWLEETQPSLNVDGDDPYPSFMLRLLFETLEGKDDPDEIREVLLDTARGALESQFRHLAKSIDDQLYRAIDRLDDQIQQRVEMAEMAIEGAELEAEEFGQEVDPREVVRAIENAAGLQIRMDSSEDGKDLDLRKLRRMIPDFIEASLGVRVWAGLVQAVERRLGEELPLEKSLPMPMDWDLNASNLQNALQEAWEKHQERLESEISRQLDLSLGKEPITEALLIRLLVQMSYGQRSFFDRKTHQKRTVTVARFSYAYSAAELIERMDPEVLREKIIDHLMGAQKVIQRLIGLAELNRLATNKLSDLDEKSRAGIRSNMDEDAYQRLEQMGELGSLPEELREQFAAALGQYQLTEAFRALILSVGDRHWVDYLTQIEALRTSIGLEAYGQRDPLVQYKSRAFDMFQQLLADVRSGVVSRLYRMQAPSQTSSPGARSRAGQQVPQQSQQASKKKKRKRRRKRR